MAFVTRLSLRLGVVVLLGVVLLFGAGIFAATQVQQDLLPDIAVPAVIVITPYPGASPEVVDAQVGVPVVNGMQGVAGADTIQSTSSQGASLVIVLFKDGTDLKSAQQDVTAPSPGFAACCPPRRSPPRSRRSPRTASRFSNTRSRRTSRWATSRASCGRRRCRS